jgi:hypothetical protein
VTSLGECDPALRVRAARHRPHGAGRRPGRPDGAAARTYTYTDSDFRALLDEWDFGSEHIIGVLRTWGDRQPTITEMAGIGARAPMTAGRDADAFWEKHTT